MTTTSTSLGAVGRHGDDAGDVGVVGSGDEKMRGRAMLLFVALLYGTLNVSLRGIYATEGPPVASVLSLVRQCLSLVAFVPIFFLASPSSSSSSSSSSSTSAGGTSTCSTTADATTTSMMSSMSSSVEEDGSEEEDVRRPLMIGDGGEDDEGDAARKKEGGGVVRPMWMSALELAFWNFGAQVR